MFGLGFGYISGELLARVRQHSVGMGGAADRQADFLNMTLSQSVNAQRYEGGGLNWLGIAGLRESVTTYLELGKDAVEAYILELSDFLYEQLAASDKIGVCHALEHKHRSGIYYITFPAEYGLTDEVLHAHGIRARVGAAAMRIGLHYYNNKEDIVRLLRYLQGF